MIKKVIFLTAALLLAQAAASAEAAGTYSGNWLVTIKDSRWANGSQCLTLTDDGSFGWQDSGEASLPGQTYPGSFQVIKGLLVATIPFASGTAEVGAFTFTGPARNGSINPGAYEEVYGGEFDSGSVKFTRNGC